MSYNYFGDRCRAVRQDIRLQQLSCAQSAACLEIGVNFHAMAGVMLANHKGFDMHLNTVQLKDSLLSLANNSHVQNDETLFQHIAVAKALLFMPDLSEMRHITFVKGKISKKLEWCVQVLQAYHTDNYVRFFKLTKSCNNILLLCILYAYQNRWIDFTLRILSNVEVFMLGE
eukprot:m.168861 g.168861  ORF g.168861 m.168861 type:complete len:172 (-) comp15323_c1_seq4:362-877(-)